MLRAIVAPAARCLLTRGAWGLAPQFAVYLEGAAVAADMRRWSHESSPRQETRLCKRMSELDLCSRREADEFIVQGRVLVRGQVVPPVLGQLVRADETNIEVLHLEKQEGTTVILHKPVGYVSGQPDDGNDGLERHVPAVRLLTPSKVHLLRDDFEKEEEYQAAHDLVFQGLSFHSRQRRRDAPLESKSNSDDSINEATLQGVVPAGRLDRDSSGLLIFTSSGVMAKKLVSAFSRIEKEYVVHVEPVQSLARYEREAGLRRLPSPRRNLKPLFSGKMRLWKDVTALRPVVEAEWLEPDSVLRLVLTEGRKRQIRRMCRELLGWHVVQLIRTRIGGIHLGSLPEGQWRPIRQEEARSILQEKSINK